LVNILAQKIAAEKRDFAKLYELAALWSFNYTCDTMETNYTE